ncbi:MAG TPA: redoxin domain-containing protein [Dehalococcoidia bacterium]|jgi:peroxiredoxin|nr:redoxin domain-containing protein [Dehalococcoidia bacterium]
MTEDELVEERPQRRRQWSGALTSVVLPVLLVAAIVLGLLWWQTRGEGGGADDGHYGIVELPADRNPTGETPKAEEGRVPPDFLLSGPAGEVRLSDLQGKAVVVNFWATWCPPCRREVPELIDAYERYRDRGLVILGVDLQESENAVRDFAEEFGIPYPLVIDRTGEVADVWNIGGQFGGIPSTYFIDPAGVVQSIYNGTLTREVLEERIGLILGADDGASAGD